jgi:putative spermidine/putrescine transport system permease protein
MTTSLDEFDGLTETIAESAPTTRAGHRRRSRRRGVDPVPWWLTAIGTVVALYLILPTIVVIPLSFSSNAAFEFPPEELSFRWYQNFFTNKAWIGSLGNSVIVAVLAALIATVVGTAAAIGLNNLAGRFAAFLRTLLMVSMVTPAIVVAVAVYISFLRWHLTGTVLGYVLAHAALGVPFVLVSVSSALGGFDRKLLRASASLGATPWRSFLRVTLPLISRGIVTGAIFAFVTSFDEVVIALFLRSPKFQTLPVQMYNSVTFELDPTISAASSLVVVAVTVILLVPLLLGTRKKSR